MTKALQAQRRASASEWSTQNPILDVGEFAFETDTRIFKVGDGAASWNQLPVPYIPSKIFTAKGDLATFGNIPEELLTNTGMNVDVNNDGIADGWTLVGSDPSHTAVTSSGQSITSSAGQTTSITRTVPVAPNYTYNLNTLFNLIAKGANTQYQVEIKIDFYTDSTLTTLVSASSTSIHISNSAPLGVTQMLNNGLTYDTAGVLLLTINIYEGASVVYTKFSFTKNHVDFITLPTTGSVPGSTLYVDAEGNLKWTTTSQATKFAPYIKSSDMAATYKTKTAADNAHSQFILAADAASTYETINNANIAHALHQYAAAAATDYHTPASLAAAGFESADQVSVVSADYTVTNTAAYTAVPGLSFAMAANATYLFEMLLIVTGNTAAGMRISTIATTASSYIFGVHAPIPNGNNTIGNVHHAVSTGTGASPGTQSIGLDGSVALFATVRGTVFNGATAGNFVFSLAQNSAIAGTSCTIGQDSFIRAIKIS